MMRSIKYFGGASLRPHALAHIYYFWCRKHIYKYAYFVDIMHEYLHTYYYYFCTSTCTHTITTSARALAHILVLLLLHHEENYYSTPILFEWQWQFMTPSSVFAFIYIYNCFKNIRRPAKEVPSLFSRLQSSTLRPLSASRSSARILSTSITSRWSHSRAK